MGRRWPLRLGISLIACCVLTAALGADSQALMLVSRKTEISVGKQVQDDAIVYYGGLSIDKKLNERVARVGSSIAAVSPRKDVTYTYQVLNSYVINAFSAPGGPVLITRKLAQMMTTDDELAFVLAHETGHTVAQHVRHMMNRNMIAQGLASVLFSGASTGVQAGVNAAYTFYDRGFSRNQEYEADAWGVKLMVQAGYNPEGAIEALAKLGMDRSHGLNKYLATHPDIPKRIDRIGRIVGISPARQQELISAAQAEEQANR